VGQGFWRLVVSVQRFCGGGGRWVTFLYENMYVGVASRMLVIMNGHSQTGGLYAFLRMFSHAGTGCGNDAWARRGTCEYVDGRWYVPR